MPTAMEVNFPVSAEVVLSTVDVPNPASDVSARNIDGMIRMKNRHNNSFLVFCCRIFAGCKTFSFRGCAVEINKLYPS